jgi:hypothetical protein
MMPFDPMKGKSSLSGSRISLLPLACAAWLIALSPAWGADRFVEFPSDTETHTYDLSTVQMIQPGRLTIVETTIDNPDVMKFELTALETLRTYCARPDGKYKAPADLLTLGPPDIPVKNIEVDSGPTTKTVLWFYPYKRLERFVGRMFCRDSLDPQKAETQLYFERRAEIANGSQGKMLFDCRRGLMGFFLHDDDDPSKVLTQLVSADTNGAMYYSGVCRAALHETPYPSQRAPN